MGIATKTGDKGDTSLLGRERVTKTDPRIEAYGTIDELNAAIGVALLYTEVKEITESLNKTQHDLFTIGAELSSLTEQPPENLPRVSSKHIERLNAEVERVEAALPTQKEFILPKGTKSGAHLHLARTICRRAERRVVECHKKHPASPEVIRYLNRLGDLLFLYARQENHGKTEEEPVSYE